MGTPMAFPGSVQTRRGAASCLLQASFAEPLSSRVAGRDRERYAIYIKHLRRDLTHVRVIHGPRPALRVAPGT